jgi:phosphoribosylaminoimidazolecarboxamide formyltransferase/IMP cyclohydrolase
VGCRGYRQVQESRLGLNRRVALISVYDKSGIGEFGRSLSDLGWELYSSGGTAKALEAVGLRVHDVAQLVGGGAILGHRVVTLSREIHAGLLARDTPADRAELDRINTPYIDLVCVDLYPLAAEIASPAATPESVIEKTDIGGPTMLRSAAKGRRIIAATPSGRAEVLAWLRAGEPEPATFRSRLAAQAECVVARYTLDSARYISAGLYDGLIGSRAIECKYGENAWQTPAGLYQTDDTDPLALHRFTLVSGASPSYNNLAELDRHVQTMTHIAAAFDLNFGSLPSIAIGTKHGNPCGVGVGSDPAQAIKDMLTGDTRAIFGGLVSVNFPIDEAFAELLLTHAQGQGRRLLDAVIAPSFTPEAVKLLGRKGDKCRFLANPALAALNQTSLDHSIRLRPVRGGFLRQPAYDFILNLKDPMLLISGELDRQASQDAVLAWAVGSTSNSNTVTVVRAGQLIGNGVGQQDRVSCCELAIKRATAAGHKTAGALAYSDSFFPFPDGPQVLINAGITAILATSGSVRDNETIDLCHKAAVTLCLLPDAVARGFFGH